MTVCTRCGEHSPAGTQFCGTCGSFLQWQEEPPAVQTAAQAPAEDQAAAVQPVAQQPTDERIHRQPTAVVTERPALNPGDLICGECGAGNVPTRKFCRHCGHSLVEAQTVKRPWWRLLVPRRRNRKRELGDRPRRRRGRPWRSAGRWIARSIAVVLVLVAALYGTVPSFRGEVNKQALAVRNWAEGVFGTKFDPVRPTKVTATAAVAGHAAILAADNAKNTFWAAPVAGGEPALVLGFDRPVDIRRAIVRSGNAADFQSAHRPAKLHLVYSTGRTFDVTLADTPDQQTVDIAESAGATSVELHIVALHRSLQGADVAISEIELFEQVS